MKPKVKSAYYGDASYDTRERFVSYWHQINEIMKLKPQSVLEVGVGSKFLSNYLKSKNVNVLTLDNNGELKPDILGSVLCMPFSPGSFDVVACCEVLEHLPYEEFQRALSELYRVSCGYVIISLPDTNRVYRFNIQVPKLGELRLLIPLPRIGKPKFDEQHYWEIDANNYCLNRILSDIRTIGFYVKRTYRVFEYPYHRFFILHK